MSPARDGSATRTLDPVPAAEALRGWENEAARRLFVRGPQEAPRKESGERRPSQKTFEGGPARRSRSRRRRQANQCRRGPVRAQPPLRRGERGKRILRSADLAKRLRSSGNPTGLVVIVGHRGNLRRVEIRARPAFVVQQPDKRTGSHLLIAAPADHPAHLVRNRTKTQTSIRAGSRSGSAWPARSRSPRRCAEPAGSRWRAGRIPIPERSRRQYRGPPASSRAFAARGMRWTPSPAARIQQNLRRCRDRVESAPKIMHMIQEVAGQHFADLPTWAKTTNWLAHS